MKDTALSIAKESAVVHVESLPHILAGPNMVVYDNACNLHRYVLRRAPKLFADTAFRIDRLHVYNHHG